MNADEVADAFITLKQAGKIKHAGVSNFTPHQFALLQSRLRFPWSPTSWRSPRSIRRGRWMVPWINTSNSASSPWPGPALAAGGCSVPRICPAAGGTRADPPGGGRRRLEQVVYAWVMMLPSQPLPLIGSGKRERIAAAVAAESIELTRQQWFRIRKAALGYDVP
jgi:hypothetical protein